MRNTPPARSRPLPRLWLLTDARTETGLAAAIRRLPRGSAIVFRHYHLGAAQRQAAFGLVRRMARRYGHRLILSGPAALARRWRADGVYGAPDGLGRRLPGLVRIATAHDLRELRAAHRAAADAVMISPVFATRSHPGGRTLGPLKLAGLARHARLPVIALGGMTKKRARRLPPFVTRWAAIDGLS